ncbi:hypothetical protein IPL68_01995 [Candidatus Saccharibacteria bacterium]|nr:MAG: hypothetical protein IPL68_01995 [Candidatus Saccharibacteria bacterium]
MTGQELCGEIAAWSQLAGVPGVVPEFGMAQNYGVIKNNNTNVFGTFLTGSSGEMPSWI